MLRRDYRDMVAGGLLVAGGLTLTIFSMTRYNIGTLRQMGPGMFPMGLGGILTAFGVLLFIQAYLRPGEKPSVRVWSPIFVLLGVASFAFLIRPMGLVPAIVAVVAISSLAELRFRPVVIITLCAALSVMAWLVFRVGLGLPLQMFKWPF